jgi:LysM repeat protein
MESSLNATVQLGATLIVAETNAVNKAFVAEADVKDSEYKKGDNLGNIAKKFDHIADLQEWNQLSSQNIALGKVLIVAKMKLPSIQPKPCRFIQKKGQCCSFHKTGNRLLR